MFKVCETCGATFEVKWPRNPNRYCSRSCNGKAGHRPRKKRITKVCETCGIVFEVKNPRNPNRYCSNACRGKAMRGPRGPLKTQVLIACKTCGTQVWLSPARARRRRYCSRACDPHFTTQFVRKTCEGCGGSYKLPPSLAGRSRFCSNRCRLAWFSSHFVGERSPQWKGGELPYYGPTWKRARRQARHRDRNRCQHCGTYGQGEAMSVHHIVPFREFGLERHHEANRLENLVCLCRSCHLRLERRERGSTNVEPVTLN